MTKSEQARADASHACDACGGAGGDHWVVRYWHDGQPVFELGFSDEATARREQDYLDRAGWGRVTCSPVETPSPCPVCRGAGRISDRMPAADALADAETLRLLWHERAEGFNLPDRFRVEHQTVALFWQAGSLGHYIPHECADSARDAARAAFRAVPGLRG